MENELILNNGVIITKGSTKNGIGIYINGYFITQTELREIAEYLQRRNEDKKGNIPELIDLLMGVI
jgi:hypothetical protein